MCELDYGYSERPDVGFDGVIATLDSLWLEDGYRGDISMDREGKRRGKRTLMYTEVPTKVLAIELISSPETPKSMSLMSPCELHRIFDGLISTGAEGDRPMSAQELKRTS